MGDWLDYWKDLQLSSVLCFDFSSARVRVVAFSYLCVLKPGLKGFVLDLLSAANGVKAPM